MSCVRKYKRHKNMAPKNSTFTLNIKRFIHDVEERPAIWNRNFHCNKAFLEQMWDELSAEHKLPKAVLKAKWKGLRDNFRVEYKRIPRSETGQLIMEPASFDSKWIYYYALLFLIDHMRHRAPKNEQELAHSSMQQSQHTVEKNIVVKGDLTNGLIRGLQDSDEEFDEIYVDEYDIDDDNQAHTMENAKREEKTTATTTSSANNIESFSPTSSSAASLMNSGENVKIPQVAHSQSLLNRSTVASTILETSSISRKPPQAHSASQKGTVTTVEGVKDLSSISSLEFLNWVARANKNNYQSHYSLDKNNGVTNNDNNVQKNHTILPPPFMEPHLTAIQNLKTSNQNTTAGKAMNAFNSNNNFFNGRENNASQSLLEIWKPQSTKRPYADVDQSSNSIPAAKSVSLVPQDDDYHYLLSLHPYMKQLNSEQKLRTRTKIQKLVFKELFKEDLEEAPK